MSALSIGVGDVAILLSVIVLLIALALLRWARMVITASFMVGALLGSVMGFWIGEANAPPPPKGTYTIGPSDWAISGAVLGLVIGSILGAAVGWALKRRRERKGRHETRLGW